MENQNNSLILLADTRKKLLWLWIIFTAGIIGLFLIMTFNNTFEGVEKRAWTWAFVSLLPMLAMLFVGVALNPQPSKVIKRSGFQLIFYGALAYLLLTLATLLGSQAWLDAHTEGGIGDYFGQSYIWILPFQILLLVGAGIFYFRKTPLFKISEKHLMELIEKKTEYAKRIGKIQQVKAFDALFESDFDKLFDVLKNDLKGTSEANDVIAQQGRYTHLKEAMDLNTIEPAEAQLNLNQISVAMIDLIERV